MKNRLTLRLLIPRMDANIVVSHGLKKRHAEKDKFDTENFSIEAHLRQFKKLYESL